MVKGIIKKIRDLIPIRAIEYLIFVLIVSIFVLTAGKYFINVNLINRSVSDLGNYIAKAENETIQEYKTYRNKPTIYNFSIANRNGVWSIIENDISVPFIISNDIKSGKISFAPETKNSKFEVNIEGVNKYYSNQNYILSDVPHQLILGNTYRAVEQEDMLPIFGYHYIVSDDVEIMDSKLEIHESMFREQIEYATNVLNCNWYVLSDIVANYIMQGKKLPRNVCAINFDDGRANNYKIAYPILEEYNAIATFYVITGRISSSDAYMTWDNLDTLFRSGHEIGSHTVLGGDLVNASWFKGDFNDEELFYQLKRSKEMLESRGYNTKTFAYPLGLSNEAVVNAVKGAGYIAARDTQKKENWRDKRSNYFSYESDKIWHLNYFKPEAISLKELDKIVSYNGWWQFEEGFANESFHNKDNVLVRSTNMPTNSSYAIVSLESEGAAIKNKFAVKSDGDYIIEIFGSTSIDSFSPYSQLGNTAVYIDGKIQHKNIGDNQSCEKVSGWVYCEYYVKVNLVAGQHTIKIESLKDRIKVDKFRVYKSLEQKDHYSVSIIQYD